MAGMISPEADTLRGQGRQVAGGDDAVPEVELRDPGVEEAAQLRPRNPASFEEDAPQGILQMRGQRPEVRVRGATWANRWREMMMFKVHYVEFNPGLNNISPDARSLSSDKETRDGIV